MESCCNTPPHSSHPFVLLTAPAPHSKVRRNNGVMLQHTTTLFTSFCLAHCSCPPFQNTTKQWSHAATHHHTLHILLCYSLLLPPNPKYDKTMESCCNVPLKHSSHPFVLLTAPAPHSKVRQSNGAMLQHTTTLFTSFCVTHLLTAPAPHSKVRQNNGVMLQHTITIFTSFCVTHCPCPPFQGAPKQLRLCYNIPLHS